MPARPSHPSRSTSHPSPPSLPYSAPARALALALLPPLSSDPPTLSRLTAHIAALLSSETGALPRLEMRDVGAVLGSRERAARIRAEEGLALALGEVRGELEGRWGSVCGVGAGERRGWDAAWDYDKPQLGEEGEGERVVLRMQTIPQHVQFLLALAQPATSRTHRFAADYLAREVLPAQDDQRALYDAIMAPPFEGAHWGPSFVPPERDEDWDLGSSVSDADGDSDGSSAQEDEVVTPLRAVGLSRADLRRAEEARSVLEAQRRLGEAQATLASLKKEAYWAQGGRKVLVEVLKDDGESKRKPDGWRETTARLTPLGLAFSLSTATAGQDTVKVVSAAELQRELVLALSGRGGVFFAFSDTDGACEVRSETPLVKSMTPAALSDTLAMFANLGTQAEQVRRFVSATLQPASPQPGADLRQSSCTALSKTVQAFAVACRELLTTYDTRLAVLEQTIVSGVLAVESAAVVATPLQLRLATQDQFGEMLSLLHSLLPLTERPYDLLHALYALLTGPVAPALDSASLDNPATLRTLFTRTATPLWTALGLWLSHGIPLPLAYTSLEAYLFASSSLDDANGETEADAPWAAERDFWIIRDQDSDWTDEDFWDAGWVARDWPAWISADLRQGVLEAGKARGLLRGLGGEEGGIDRADTWKSLEEVLSALHAGEEFFGEVRWDRETTDRAIADYLEPVCRIPAFRLRRVLSEQCGLEAHLEAINGVFYQMGHRVWDQWAIWLFQKMNAGKNWYDSQALTTAFRDTAESLGEHWLNAPAVRIRPPHLQSQTALDILASVRISYEMPFPLSQLFTPTSLSLRSEAFGFLLQMRYTQHLLADSRFRRPAFTQSADSTERRIVHHHSLLVRQRLVHVFTGLASWLTDRILGPQTARHAERLESLTGLGEMIQAELHHSRLIRDFCLAHEKTAELRRVVSELMGIVYEVWTEYAPSPSAGSKTATRVQRGGRVVADSETDSDPEDADMEAPGLTSNKAAVSRELNLAGIMGTSAEVDQLVGQLRAGVEELAAEPGQEEVQREGWEMLAFALKG